MKKSSTLTPPESGPWIQHKARLGFMQKMEDPRWAHLLKGGKDFSSDSELKLWGEGKLAPLQVFSEEYLAAYRGSRRVGTLPKMQLVAAVRARGWTTSEKDLPSVLARRHIGISQSPASSRAVLSSLTPFALTDGLPELPVKTVSWFQLQWTQAILLDVVGTLDHLNTVGNRSFKVRVTDAMGVGIPDAKVTLVYSRSSRTGIEVRTDEHGVAAVVVPRGRTALDGIAVVPRHGFWSFAALQWSVPAEDAVIVLQPLGSAHVNQFKYLPPADPEAGKGVRCAVIDSGVGPHPALTVVDGANFVDADEEDPADLHSHADNGTGHGTHVAGIIAARALDGGHPAGIAPQVELFSFRVAARLSREAASYAIVDAIDAAVKKGCHLINLSLGLADRDQEVEGAVARAYEAGAVLVAAVGNAPGEPIMCPASSQQAIGVAALGDKARLLAGTMSAFAYRELPRGHHPDDFIANFNSLGPEVKVAVPGVGIISCAPGTQPLYCAQDGTSMAAPVVTGYAARLLASRPDILKMKGKVRADAISALLIDACDRLGFAKTDVGHGHPKP